MALDPNTEAYYTKLLGPAEAETVAAPVATKVGGRLKSLKGAAKSFGPGLVAWLMLDKFLESRHQTKMQEIELKGMANQAAGMSKDNLYYQAALPQAQQEEQAAKQALFAQLSGGIIGPSLARGERMIGG